MTETRQCRNCYVPFEAKRDDHFFCSGKCVAAFYRKHPNPEFIHADLPHDKPHHCEYCGIFYTVNAYAERGGQRAPKYCSPKCKQAAYRARGLGTQEQAQRRYSQQQRDNAQERERAREQARQQQQEQARRAEQESYRRWEQARQRQREQNRTNARPSKLEEAAAILGIEPTADSATIKAAYRRLMKDWHPDINHSPEATEMAQKINWAYEYMK